MNKAYVRSKIIPVIKTYGHPITIKRRVTDHTPGYYTETGEQDVATIDMVIDNSSLSSSNSNDTDTNIFSLDYFTATVYFAYDKDLDIRKDDYFEYNKKHYVFTEVMDIMEQNIAYQGTVKGCEIDNVRR